MKLKRLMTNPNHSRGITLIELMVVIVVVAVLGSLAVSSYRGYLMRTNRTEAKMALLRVQAAQEKFFLQQNAYASALATAPPAGLGIPSTTPGGYYTITLNRPTETEYTATATATGGQAEDTDCAAFTINESGERTPPDSSGCWR